MAIYSLTIRPRANINKEWQDKLITEFSRKFYGDWIISWEKGNSTEVNHLQVGLETNSRSNNINKRIKKVLAYEPEDDEEERVWFKLKTHKDKAYLFGYCTKEGDYKTNAVKIDDYIEEYKKKKEKFENIPLNKSYTIKSINQIFPVAIKFAEENNLPKINFHRLAKIMFSAQLMPYTIWARIRTRHLEEEWYMYQKILDNAHFDDLYDGSMNQSMDNKTTY